MYLSRQQAAQKRLEAAKSGALSPEQIAAHEKTQAFLAACEQGDASAAEELLRQDALFGTLRDAVDASGATGLALAAKHGYTDVMELCLRYGSNIHSHDGERPPLCWAADHGHAEACRLLLAPREGGRPSANVNARDAFGFTALIDSAKSGREDIVELLLRAGANVNAATPSGSTALHFAARANCAPVVAALLRHGADVSLRTDANFTAETLAGQAGHIEMGASGPAAARRSATRNVRARAPTHPTHPPPSPHSLQRCC